MSISEKDNFRTRAAEYVATGTPLYWRLVQAFARVGRTLDLLRLATGRISVHGENMEAALAVFRANTTQSYSGPANAAMVKAMGRLDQAMLEAEYDMGAYFQFAKILLDQTAQMIEATFGGARNLTLNSHHNLVDDLTKYAQAKGLEADDVIDRAKQLRTDVSFARDKIFVHDNDVESLRAVLAGPDGPEIVAHWTSKQGELRPRAVAVLHPDVEAYIEAVFDLFNRHRALIARRGRREPKTRPPASSA